MTQVVIDPARAHLTKAKILARSWMPYMSHILTSMRTYVGPYVSTMAVDQHARLYVNPGWIQTLSVRQVSYVLLHEVLHVVLSHAKRRRQFLPEPKLADRCIEAQRLSLRVARTAIDR